MQVILETSISRYLILDQIGYGATCTVYKGYSLEDDLKKPVAIKLFNENGKKYFDKKILINNNLPPQYFIPIYNSGDGIITKENADPGINYSLQTIYSFDKYMGKVYYIIEELLENGELFDYVYETKQGFSERISAKIFSIILKKVKILHDNRIAHCDIKPENIIIGNDFSIKLIDFGFSELLKKDDNFLYDYKGSDIYASPEVKNRNMDGYDGIKNDIFSLAVLLFVLTVGRFPFERSSYLDRKYRLIMMKKYDDYWSYFEQYNLSDEFKQLMNHIFCYDPSERLTIDEILEQPWIKIYTNDNELNNNNIIRTENDFDEEIVEELRKRKEIIDAKKSLN